MRQHDIGFNTVRTVGPALGGIVVASFGLVTALAVTTLSLPGTAGDHMALQVEGSLLTSRA
ncbi:hypothetical protein MesoLj113a_72080 [Mesorhizobium sp. 113-1-2]|nr:hypothetical protein MesoLj113a_72080 [Mesorhizobium sp. 113-1-2]